MFTCLKRLLETTVVAIKRPTRPGPSKSSGYAELVPKVDWLREFWFHSCSEHDEGLPDVTLNSLLLDSQNVESDGLR